MMSCLQVTQAASDFLERRLKLRERIGVLMHLAVCQGCCAYVEQIRLTVVGLCSLPDPAKPGAKHDVLLEHFREGSKRQES